MANRDHPARILGVSQAARFLERSENFVRFLADRGDIECERDGANRRVFTPEGLARAKATLSRRAGRRGS